MLLVLLLKTELVTERKEQIKIREREGGDTGEEVVKYSGRGVDTMGGREEKIDKEGTDEGICGGTESSGGQLRGKGRSEQKARLRARSSRRN